jgi:hypothetical protein
VTREQGFISDFLHINALDASITFADYMMLETYFRRGATSYLATQQGKLKDVRSAMDLVFGFLDNELGEWIEFVLGKDSMYVPLPLLLTGLLIKWLGKSWEYWQRSIGPSSMPKKTGTNLSSVLFRSTTNDPSSLLNQPAYVAQLLCTDGC